MRRLGAEVRLTFNLPRLPDLPDPLVVHTCRGNGSSSHGHAVISILGNWRSGGSRSDIFFFALKSAAASMWGKAILASVLPDAAW